MKLTKSYLKEIIKEELEMEAGKRKTTSAPTKDEGPPPHESLADAVAALEKDPGTIQMFKDGKVSGLQMYGSVRKRGEGEYVVRVVSPVDYKNKFYNAKNPLDLGTYVQDKTYDNY